MLRIAIWVAVSSEEQAKDKASLPTQLAEARAIAEKMGGSIVAEYLVEGHSRFYIELRDAIEITMKDGITAYRDLQNDWINQRFDVLIARAGDRLARTPSLLITMIESIIRVGKARIVFSHGGELNESNYIGFMSMLGWEIGNFAQQKVHYSDIGSKKRVEKGLPATSHDSLHEYVRDSRGRAVGMVLREDMRLVLRDMAELILEGVALNALGQQLFDRYGHVNPDTGRRWGQSFVWRVLYNPFTWGHSAWKYSYERGSWAYDLDVPVPEKVVVFRFTHEPVWSGRLGEDLIAELRRRGTVVQGRGSADSGYAFTGLVICRSCGYRMSVNPVPGAGGRTLLYWVCLTNYMHKRFGNRGTCGIEGSNRLNDLQVRAFVDGLLGALIEAGSPDALDGVDDSILSARREAELVGERIADLESQLDTLIYEQSRAARGVQERYRTQIDLVAEQLDSLRVRLSSLGGALAVGSVAVARDRRLALEEIKGQGVDAFWCMAPAVQNRLLHRLLGAWRLRAEGGAITGLMLPRYPRRGKGSQR